MVWALGHEPRTSEAMPIEGENGCVCSGTLLWSR
ncbi:MAG: hypothetical protein KatS3mg060_3420 [Dehalococcoidia bacterium]|nr:MAG: hypothetical protein KatS3mg060_3420 [Dehalococcoidia bacterium]